MKNRNVVLKKLSYIEGGIRALETMVNTGAPVSEFVNKLSQIKQMNGEVQDIIEREDFSPNEINRI